MRRPEIIGDADVPLGAFSGFNCSGIATFRWAPAFKDNPENAVKKWFRELTQTQRRRIAGILRWKLKAGWWWRGGEKRQNSGTSSDLWLYEGDYMAKSKFTEVGWVHFLKVWVFISHCYSILQICVPSNLLIKISLVKWKVRQYWPWPSSLQWTLLTGNVSFYRTGQVNK